MLFFTADLHAFHDNIIKYENRPFKSVKEMNETIISNHNSVVSDNDDVYILGDIGFTTPELMLNFLKQLKGRKYWIYGNHDKRILKDKLIREQFIWCKDYFKLKYNNEQIILFHYPIFAWDCKHHGAWHLHGHVHSSSHEDFYYPTKLNVGVDLWNFTPVSFDRIKEKIDSNLKLGCVIHENNNSLRG